MPSGRMRGDGVTSAGTASSVLQSEGVDDDDNNMVGDDIANDGDDIDEVVTPLWSDG